MLVGDVQVGIVSFGDGCARDVSGGKALGAFGFLVEACEKQR